MGVDKSWSGMGWDWIFSRQSQGRTLTFWPWTWNIGIEGLQSYKKGANDEKVYERRIKPSATSGDSYSESISHVDAVGCLQHHQHMRRQSAFDGMKPVEIVGVVLVRGRECEIPVAVHVDNVFGAGGGFGEREASVLMMGA